MTKFVIKDGYMNYKVKGDFFQGKIKEDSDPDLNPDPVCF